METKGAKGFTLVELMIVICIVGILSAIAMIQYGSYREKSFVSTMYADVQSVRTSQEAYFAQHNNYTAGTSDLTGFGFRSYHKGNGGAITIGAGSYIITVTSTNTAKTVTYDSSLGTTVTN